MNSRKIKATTLLIVFLSGTFLPTATFALGGGPSQPEFQSFEPVGTSEMVDVSSGSFTYNIPLTSVGGYPINLAYHSSSTPDQEASTVGLNWNINPGTITRNMRGIPDDFDGDQVEKEFNIEEHRTYGGTLGFKGEVFGVDGLGLQASLGGYYSNYTGVGFEYGVAPSLSIGDASSGKLTAGLGLTADSRSGIGISPSLSFDVVIDEREKSDLDLGNTLSASFNSRQGLKSVTYGASLSITPVHNRKLINGKTTKGVRDEKKTSQKFAGSYTHSFVKPTYTPRIQFPMFNSSFTFAGTVGGAVFGFHGSVFVTGYYSTQKLLKKSQLSPSFGTLYAHKGKDKLGALHDFNRQNDGSWNRYMPNLPVPYRTNDIYSVVGQGIGGSYQLKRGDVGVVYDPDTRSSSQGDNLGVEIGAGGLAHGGVDLQVAYTYQKTGKWTKDNNALSHLDFKELTVNNNHYEPAYFKAAGEKSVETDPGFLDKIGGTEAKRVALETPSGLSLKVRTQKKLVHRSDSEPGTALTGDVKREKRERRNQVISYLTAEEAKNFGLWGELRNYELNDFDLSQYTSIPHVDSNRKSHHIGEITVLRPDGVRYVYAPAYNTLQEEVSFNVSDNVPNQLDCQDGLIGYDPQDASQDNDNGIDHYFNKVTTPPYAHTYRLVAVLSPDYNDRTGNGPTIDDPGSYTVINYTRLYSDYQWRIPYRDANYDPGFLADEDDDKASYIYGQKEMWYIHSMVSKTEVAEFHYYEDINTFRRDAYEPDGDTGGQPNNPRRLPALQKIVTYTKPEQAKSNGIPIKTVHFEYDHSLCPGTENAANGKLTLEKLWFTYGSSQKGRLSPYEFTYGEAPSGNQVNPDYNLKAYNRWGHYQENSGNPLVACAQQPNSYTGIPNNVDYPYAHQPGFQGVTAEDLDEVASAWNLTGIKLPSGARIKVNYESHKIAYVMDKRVMQMVEVAGVGSVGSSDLALGNRLFFNLSEPLDGTWSLASARNYIRDYYLGDNVLGKGKYLYFKCLVRSCGDHWVYGYAKVTAYGAIKNASTDYDIGYVDLEEVCINDKEKNCGTMVNPIAKATWQSIRLNLPRIAYNQTDPFVSGIAQTINAIAGMGLQLKQLVQGFNKELRSRCGAALELERSWIRLNNPTRHHYVGGSRVASITISDEWDAMAGSNYDRAEYGQVYDYTKEEIQPDGLTMKISSGVAAAGPMLGGDVNPYREPVFYDETLLLAPDNNHYMEKVMGEPLFPAPSIVYERVEVRNLPHQDVRRTATGKIVHTYHTARTFPTKVDETPLKAIPKKTNPIFKFLKIQNNDYMTTSMGYSVELNDMHGKPEAQWIYDENGTLLSGIEYKYKRTGDRLDNRATVINPDGTVQNALIGIEYDMIADARESENRVEGSGINPNIDAFIAGIIPIGVPIILPGLTKEKTRFRSMVLTKVINRYALLDKTVVHDQNSKVETQNLAYDAETGEVLLTRTTNEFNDPLYSLTFPSHWGYEGMEGAYQNIGAVFDISSNSPGTNSAFFTPGDEVIVNVGSQTKRGWVIQANNSSIALVDRFGNSINGTITKIIRSGHRNQQTEPIGSLASLANPIAGNQVNFNAISGQVVNAGAIEFSDNWQTQCQFETDTCNSLNPKQPVNPYVLGLKGNYRPKKSWTYLATRQQDIPDATGLLTSGETNIRRDGVYADFSSFWNPTLNGNDTWMRNESGWTWMNEVTMVHPNGNEIENRDLLDRYSAELLGYNELFVTAVAANAKYRQIVFDGFEDYKFSLNSECRPKRHLDFGLTSTSQELTEEARHTGKYAIRLEPGASLQSATAQVEIDELLQLDDCIPLFLPDTGRYVFSAWVKEERPATVFEYQEAHYEVIVDGTTVHTFSASGELIEGWARVYGEFYLPPGASSVVVRLLASPSVVSYFDDIRIHPFDASFKSFVYDDENLRFTYELDNNNFFTKYEYDQSGMLERVKKETERGVMTIQESYFGQQKKP